MIYDVIVIGAGGVGSAAVYHLALRGLKVLVLDRFPIGHDRGSSHGQTRVIRQAYFEHPNYVPLLLRAYDLWADLEAASGRELYRGVGLLEVGPEDGEVVPGVLASARQHGLDVALLDADEANTRFPGFHIPDEFKAVFEHRAGYLFVERCVLAHLKLGMYFGAEIRTDSFVRDWMASDRDVVVRTDSDVHRASSLVITAGSWSSDLLAQLDIPMKVLRKHLHWYASGDARYDQARGCPTFLYELADGCFYGFPEIGDNGVKVAEHSGGTPIRDPLSVDRSIDTHDQQRVDRFVAEYLPGVSNKHVDHSVCLYTMSPDEAFVVDRHPVHKNIAFAAALSGHGFKFTSAIGEVLADLITKGKSELPIQFLRCGRFEGQSSSGDW